MASVADLYQQVLGRAPDAAGLAYWESMFGSTVDPTEASTFKSVAQVTEPTAVAQTPQPIEAAPAVASTGSTMPTTVEDVYKTFYGTVDPAGAAYWKSQFGGNAIDPQQASLMINEIGKNNPNIDTGLTVEQAFKNYLGGNTDQAGIDFWKSQFGSGPLTVNQLSQLTNTQSGINTDTGGGGLFGSGIGPDLSWTKVRDLGEAAGVVAGNYFLPGSSLVSGQLVSEGAKEQLATPVGMLANVGAGVAGGMAGNLDNYGKFIPGSSGLESVTPEQLAAANATDDPIAALNAIKGWTTADTAYLASIGGMTPDILSAANANNAYLAGGASAAGINTPVGAGTGAGAGAATTGLTAAQTAQLAKAGLGVAGLLGGTAALGGLTVGSGSGVSLPAQDRSGVSSGSAQYSPEYYAALQSKYNQLMPAQPRDVTTDLKNWYETKYSPKVA